MLQYFLVPYADQFQFFNLFRYITFRTGGAIMTALAIGLIMGPGLIDWLRLKQGKGQPIRSDGPESHLITKRGTPTMGGFLILISLFVSTLLWADIRNPYVWIVLFVTAGYGAVGFYDDFMKVTKQSHKGAGGKVRLAIEFLIAGLAVYAVMLVQETPLSGAVAFPVFKDYLLQLGFVFIAFGCVVIVGAGNAVNFTDGLDGLAIVPVMIAAATFGLIAYLVGNGVFSEYLQIHFIPGTGEIAIFCGALLGAGLAFLWFNAPPAMVFMGDTGSLALGGALGAIAVATKHEIVLAIVGGLFVLELVSVVVQVASFRLTGKRVFLMAPIHHHYEKLGWKEPTIVIRFWIVAFVLALIGLSTLKLR